MEETRFGIRMPCDDDGFILLRCPHCGELLKLTAEDLLELGVIERVFPESDGFDALYPRIQGALIETLDRYAAMDTAALLKQRYQKFRCIGGQL